MKSLKNQCVEILERMVREEHRNIARYTLYGKPKAVSMVKLYDGGPFDIVGDACAICCKGDRYSTTTGKDISTTRAIKQIASNKKHAAYIVKKYG